MVVVQKIQCKSIISKTKISGAEYSINPYVGCEHGCLYCYARFMRRFSGHKEEWGQFVDVKVNAVSIASHQLSKLRKGLTLLSSVTDPYQPLERVYELTRKLLEKLVIYGFPVSILTKSSLVTRDIDLFKSFQTCSVGMSLTTFDEEIRKRFEPHSSSIEERFFALNKLADENVSTYVFLGPILPFITEKTLMRLVDEIIGVKPDYILLDKLNIKYGNWKSILSMLKKHYSEDIESWKSVLFTDSTYYKTIKINISNIFNKSGLTYHFCY